ncbi:MAG: PAS domain S-box protein [Candidatus Thiodiazotropha sp.]
MNGEHKAEPIRTPGLLPEENDRHKTIYRLVISLAVKLFIPLSVIILVGVWYYGNIQEEKELVKWQSAESEMTYVVAEHLTHHFDNISRDLTYLVQSEALRDVLERADENRISILTRDLIEFSQAKEFYDQIRWIDEYGQERVRVDYDPNGSYAVPVKDLQDKSSRYYFADTMELKANQFYVSPLDLNVERGEIEVPYKPMLRVSTPVVDRDGNRRGILVLNYFGKYLLEAAGVETQNIGILNSEGYWLKTHSKQDEWGFMFGNEQASLAVTNPGVWQRFKGQSQGQYEGEDGLWTWYTVYPLVSKLLLKEGSGNTNMPELKSGLKDNYHWIVVSRVNADVLNELRQDISEQTILQAMVLLLMILLLTIRIGRSEYEVLSMNERLASDVRERTRMLRSKLSELEEVIREKDRTRTILDEKSSLLIEANRLAKLGHWHWDVVSDRHVWSDEIYQIYGRDQALGPAVYPEVEKYFTQNSWRDLSLAVEKALHSGEPYECDAEVIQPGGQHRWITARGQAIKNQAGVVEVMHGTVQDITERKLSTIQLERFRSLLDHARDAIFLANPSNGRILDVNQSVSTIYGYSREELLTMHICDLQPNLGDSTTCEQHLASLRSTGTLLVETENRKKDGTTFPAEIAIAYTDETTQGYIIAIARDISQRKITEQQLLASEGRFRSIFDNAPVGIALVDDAGRPVLSNRALQMMLGYSESQLKELPFTEFTFPEDVDKDLDLFTRMIANEIPFYSMEKRYLRQDGNVLWGDLTVTRYYDDAKKTYYTLGMVNDITERKIAEENQRLAASMFENTAEGVMITDRKGRIIRVNRAFTDITGYQPSEVAGKNPNILSSGQHDEDFYNRMWRALDASGHWRGEIWNRRKDGGAYPELLTISRVTDEEDRVTHYVGVFSDISHLKHTQEKLDYLAHHDPLTNLPNRLFLNERLEHAIQQAKRTQSMLALIYLDLDNFKHINDSMGHPVGDEVLREVASYLLYTVREGDTVVRLGGDEFVLLLEDIRDPTNAASVAAKLLRAFTESIITEQREIHISASIGICLYPRDGDNSETLLRNADAAMYRAKSLGRNRYAFYTMELTQQAYERVTMENDLRVAVEANQLYLVYQPQIDLLSGEVTGIEALLRWSHPKKGEIPPSLFVPLAEECGLMVSIGEWVLENACRQAVAWLAAGIDFTHIAVNLSGRQIQQPELNDIVSSVLQTTGLPPERLELEVTENFILEHAEQGISKLHELRQRRISLALDDFGTGYSSLTYLKRLPVHKLKLDKSFVQDLPWDDDDRAISASVIELGRSLGMTVIAEGIESEEQASFLRQQGCHQAQGYLFYRPVRPEELTRRLKKRPLSH